jgi:hypothetical protein
MVLEMQQLIFLTRFDGVGDAAALHPRQIRLAHGVLVKKKCDALPIVQKILY